jgi:hypothetical protein
MLLYADRKGDLRVVITMRAARLRSFSGESFPSFSLFFLHYSNLIVGHAALPGGKADSLDETPCNTPLSPFLPSFIQA